MNEFFSKSEIADVSVALKDVTGAGIQVDRYPSGDPQRQTFFDKAKLWRVLDRVISVLYLSRLAEGKMFLHDTDGDEYRVTKVTP